MSTRISHQAEPAPDPIAVSERTYAGAPLLHNHSYYQLLFPGQGTLQLRVDGGQTAVSAADWGLIHPGAEHIFWSEGPNRFLVVDLAAPVVEAARDELAPGGAAMGLVRLPLDGRLATLSMLLQRELQVGALAERPVADALAGYVGVAVALALRPAARAVPMSPSARLAARARDYLEAHAYEPISLAEVAAAAGSSVAHLQRSFRAAYGVTAVAHLQALRVRRAQELLRDTDMPVEAIAAAVGFSSPSYFSRLFTRMVGVPPARTRTRSPG